MITIKLKQLYADHEHWLVKNVGPRLHYLHNSVGGEGWIAKKSYEEVDYTNMQGNESKIRVLCWYLSFEKDSHATWFRIMFPE